MPVPMNLHFGACKLVLDGDDIPLRILQQGVPLGDACCAALPTEHRLIFHLYSQPVVRYLLGKEV